MITVRIDSLISRVPEGTTALQAARDLGIRIPTLCYYEGLRPYAGCRLCVVEIIRNGSVRLMSACDTPVEDGMAVRTNTAQIKKGRKVLAELLLARCPDQKPVLEIAEELGVKRSRFSPKDSNCTLCGLCTRICEEVAGAGAIALFGRAKNKRVGTPFDKPPKECIGCGGCTFICLTGAMHLQEEALREFRLLSGAMRRCRYERMGIVQWRVCPNSYQCGRCEYNMAMEDMCPTHPIFMARPADLKKVSEVRGMNILPKAKYHACHTWIKPLDGLTSIGLDDFASRVVGGIKEVVLPGEKTDVDKDSDSFVVRGRKMSARFYFPLSGKIARINQDIMDHPRLVNYDPYGRGWIAVIEPSNIVSELSDLITGKNAVGWFESEIIRLENFLAERRGEFIVGSRESLDEALRGLDSEGKKRLVDQFFCSV